MKKLFSCGLLMALALLITACGLSNQSGRTAGTGDYAVTITNNTGERVCYLFVSSSENDQWGEDYLGDTGVLDNGGVFTVRVEEKGDYDLMVVLETSPNTCDGDGRQITNLSFTIDGEQSWVVTG